MKLPFKSITVVDENNTVLASISVTEVIEKDGIHVIFESEDKEHDKETTESKRLITKSKV